MSSVILDFQTVLGNNIRLDLKQTGFILLVVGVLGSLLGWMVVQNPKDALYVALFTGLALLGFYILSGATFDKLMYLMFLTLPFQSAFVLNLGITVRPSHLFGALAIGFGLYLRRLHKIRKHPALLFLVGFIFVTCLSLFMTLKAEVVTYWEVSGIRGLPIRSIIQFLQLLGMVVLMVLTVGFCSTWLRFKQTTDLIIIGALFSLAYGIYGFVGPLLGVPYIDINNAMNTDYSFGYKEQGISFEGYGIPRPRSTFQEPLNFGNFLLFAIPLTVVSLSGKRARGKIIGLAVVVSAIFLLLFFISSRGAIIGLFVALVAMLAFIRRFRNLGLPIGWTLVFLGVTMGAAYFLVPLLIQGMDFWKLTDFFWSRLWLAMESGGRVHATWSAVLPLFLDNLWLGIGFGNFTFYAGRLEGSEPIGIVDVVGLYFRLLVETGVVATLLYVMFVGCILWSLWRIGRTLDGEKHMRFYAMAVFFSVVADAVQRLSFGGIATDVHLWVMFGLGLALINLCRRRSVLEPVYKFGRK